MMECRLPRISYPHRSVPLTLAFNVWLTYARKVLALKFMLATVRFTQDLKTWFPSTSSTFLSVCLAHWISSSPRWNFAGVKNWSMGLSPWGCQSHSYPGEFVDLTRRAGSSALTWASAARTCQAGVLDDLSLSPGGWSGGVVTLGIDKRTGLRCVWLLSFVDLQILGSLEHSLFGSSLWFGLSPVVVLCCSEALWSWQ